MDKDLVYLLGIQLQARIELESMLAANTEREHRGEALAYGEEQILSLIEKYGIHHNALCSALYGR